VQPKWLANARDHDVVGDAVRGRGTVGAKAVSGSGESAFPVFCGSVNAAVRCVDAGSGAHRSVQKAASATGAAGLAGPSGRHTTPQPAKECNPPTRRPLRRPKCAVPVRFLSGITVGKMGLNVCWPLPPFRFAPHRRPWTARVARDARRQITGPEHNLQRTRGNDPSTSEPTLPVPPALRTPS
jgi:hypothetical protein